MQGLGGMVAVVTGGALGIGRAICLQLARDGPDVAIWDINIPGAEETARLIRDLGKRATAYETNVASAAAIELALARTHAGLGIPAMLAAGWGRIINITSSAVHMGSTGMAHYVAAKGGLSALTRVLALEYAASAVTVNNVPPGYVETPTMRRLQASNPHSSRSFEEAVASFPVKRAGKPEDFAGAVSYLASDVSSYVSGQTIHVNGARVFS
jgi:2-hydroxycyclohexanecarboxyl-CoA dehydrogenase